MISVRRQTLVFSLESFRLCGFSSIANISSKAFVWGFDEKWPAVEPWLRVVLFTVLMYIVTVTYIVTVEVAGVRA